MKTKEQLLQEHLNDGGISDESFIAGFDAGVRHCADDMMLVRDESAKALTDMKRDIDARNAQLAQGEQSDDEYTELKEGAAKTVGLSYGKEGSKDYVTAHDAFVIALGFTKSLVERARLAERARSERLLSVLKDLMPGIDDYWLGLNMEKYDRAKKAIAEYENSKEHK